MATIALVALLVSAAAVQRLPQPLPQRLPQRLPQWREAPEYLRQFAPAGTRAGAYQISLTPNFTTRRAGTGLGLPIAKNIIEGLGGTVAVFSERGAGTEIRIELPMASGAHA